MALNPAVALDKGGALVPVPQPGEALYLRREDVDFQCKLQGKGYYKGKGCVVLSSQRIVFLCESKSKRPEFEAFEVPLERFGKHKFKQTVFGVGSLVGDIQSSLANSSSTSSSYSVSFKFNSGSCGCFKHIFRMAIDQALGLGSVSFTSVEAMFGKCSDSHDPSVPYLVQPTLQMNDSMRCQLEADSDKTIELEKIVERFRLHCADVDDECRAALHSAVDNLHRACPSVASSVENCLADFNMRHNRAWLMCGAVEKAMSISFVQVLQVLHICLVALRDVLLNCADSLRQLTTLHDTQSDCEMAMQSSKFQNFLRGLGVLRRLLWRFSILTEVFLPRETSAHMDCFGDTPNGTRLDKILSNASFCFAEAKAAWAQVEFELIGLGLDRSLGRWDPGSFFEAEGYTLSWNGHEKYGDSHTTDHKHPDWSNVPLHVNGHRCQEPNGHGYRQNGNSLCTLCMLPVQPLREPNATYEPMVFKIPGDLAAASAQWRGRLWHVQCANFWKEHGIGCWNREYTDWPEPFAYLE